MRSFLLSPFTSMRLLLVLLLIHELSIQTILKKSLRDLFENNFYGQFTICIQPLRFTWYDNSLSCCIIKLYIRIVSYLLIAMLSKKSLDSSLDVLASAFSVKKVPISMYNYSFFYFCNILFI